MSTKPSLVFSHGILADGSCFNKVMPTFQAEGHEVISAQYGLDTNVADVEATRYYLGQDQRQGEGGVHRRQCCVGDRRIPCVQAHRTHLQPMITASLSPGT